MVETRLNPLKSFGSIDALALGFVGFATVYVVSTSALNGVTGPAVTSDIFKSSHLSLDLTFTQRGVKAVAPVVRIETFVEVPT